MDLILNFMLRYQLDKVFFNNHILTMFGYYQIQKIHSVLRLNWDLQINSKRQIKLLMYLIWLMIYATQMMLQNKFIFVYVNILYF
jgi:hypothetical protein